MNQRILLTGASGFVGQALAKHLLQQSINLVCPTRRLLSWQSETMFNPVMGDLNATTDWSAWLTDVDAVVHCAARVHVMQESAADPLSLFRQINVDASLRLAQQAAAAGVRRFIFLSSVKVNGEATAPGHPFRESDMAAPQDPYGMSKLEAETALLALGRSTGMAVTIIRPPLIYGPGVKANFLSMMRWVQKGIPLPLGSIHNQRSFVYLDNLLSLISCCLQHPGAAQEVFLVSDGQDVSTTELLQHCATALQVPSRLLPVPATLLNLAARLLGRQSIADRLCGSLQVDISKAHRLLGWTPPYTVDQGLRATAITLSSSSHV
ncbi:UDP-glucose 4-epimerase family protein [Undibacterium sp. SXout7W]|uniref:UDP-glucose 4-epimerase family protein n=1 Tax=Undibacterium sp. SXout7W TaxID=3413049 RepID=UPI003BF25133